MELVFPFLLNKLPLKIYSILGDGEKLLGQTSKESILPKDYIAVVGDSYAAGWGDWKRKQAENNWFSRPDYQLTHLLHRKINRDVVTFGVPGVGNVPAAVELVALFNYVNSLWAFKLEKPKEILVYFYEGNDVYNNIKDTLWLFNKKHDKKYLKDVSFFQNFIKESYLQNHPLSQNKSAWKNLIFTKFVFSLFKATWDKIRSKIKIFNNETSEIQGSSPPLKSYNINTILVNGQKIQLPKTIQGPAFVGKPKSDIFAKIDEEDLDKSIYIFEQSLMFLNNFFESIPIKIVYIPSPLAVYQILSPLVMYDHWTDMYSSKKYYIVKSSLINAQSRELCKMIESKAKKFNFQFLNAGNFLRNAAKNQLVHGPKDWVHLNKKGYETLLKGIMEAFFENNKQNGFGCAN